MSSELFKRERKKFHDIVENHYNKYKIRRLTITEKKTSGNISKFCQ